MADYIDRDAFIKHYRELLCKDCERRKGTKNGKLKFCYEIGDAPCRACSVDDMFGRLEEFPAADVQCENKWIPTSERPPENNDPVNITWVNHNPEPYYRSIKDVPFTATGHYHGGKWWWYSSVCQDYLDEYGKSNWDAMSEDIEVTAWMPLPEPYRESEE